MNRSGIGNLMVLFVNRLIFHMSLAPKMVGIKFIVEKVFVAIPAIMSKCV